MYKKKQTDFLIKESLLTLLTDKSVNKITINDICYKANIKRSTFYNHYRDKYHVLEEINAEICFQIDIYLKRRFSLIKIETILCEMVQVIDTRSFLILIDIQYENINLKRDIQYIIEKRFHNFFLQNTLALKVDVSEVFLTSLFSSISLTFIESSVKNGNVTSNAEFVSILYQMLLRQYDIKI